jgi:HAD superfamily hydrolase (TIGR01509 family)
MLKVIIFDYDGVLFPDEYAGIRSLCPDEGALENIEKCYYDKLSCEDFWNELRKHFSLVNSDAELQERYNAQTSAQLAYELEMMRHVRILSQTYRIALLSNQVSDRTAYLRETKDFSAFEHVFFSSEIALAKPQKKIFNFVIKILGIDPHECLFIDDDATNVAVASLVGMDTVRYTSFSQLKRDLEVRGVRRV